MLYWVVWLLIVIASTGTVNASVPSTFQISFSRVSDVALQFMKDSTIAPKQVQNPTGMICWSHSLSVPVLRYRMAVPETGDLRITVKELRLRNEEKFGSGFTNLFKPTIKRIGIERGYCIASIEIPLVFNSFVSQEYLIADGGLITVIFPVQEISNALNVITERPEDVINPGFKTEFSNLRTQKSKNLASALDQSKDYVKLSTTKDGIAVVRGKDLLSIYSGWKNLPVKGLHLTHFGKEYPLYIEDTGSNISESTEIYFLGSRAKGDTTWFNNFTNQSSFFLHYDTLTASLRYSSFAFQPSAPLLTKLYQKQHYEKETDYSGGYSTGFDEFTVLVSENVPGEKWYWKATDQYNKFTYPILLSPTLDDSISITLRYNTKNNDATYSPDQHPQFLVNSILQKEEVFDGPSERDFKKVFSPTEIVDGASEITFQSITDQTKTYVSSQYVDYFEVEGFQVPIAIGGMYSGELDINSQKNIQIPGFTSNVVYVVDTLHQRFDKVKATTGFTIRLGAQKGQSGNSWQSVVINDSVINNTKESQLTIATLQAPDFDIYKASKWEGNASDTKAVDYISQLPAGSLIIITYNDISTISTSIKSLLLQHKSSLIEGVTNQQVYVASFLKGDINSLIERSGERNANFSNFVQHPLGNSFQVTFTIQDGKSNLILTDNKHIETAEIEVVPKNVLRDTNKTYEYIIITHTDFITQAKQLEGYRSKQGWKSITVDVQDIYNEFGFGFSEPIAIKKFLEYAYFNWRKPSPRYVLLVGDASWDTRQLAPQAIMKNYIPSFDNPVSDWKFVLLDGDDYLAEMTIGRLPCKTPIQAQNIVDKIIEYDTTKPDNWWKKFLFISGGYGLSEEEQMYNTARYRISPYISDITNPFRLCGDTITAALYLTHAVSGFSMSNHIISKINEGCSWVNYLGHGAPSVMQVGGWDPPILNNKGKYPVLATFSCKNGGFAENNVEATNELYMREKDKGVVAAFGTTGYGFTTIDEEFNSLLFFSMADVSFRRRKLGDLLFNTKRLFITDRESDIKYVNIFNQTSLLGDPLSRLPFDTLAYPYVKSTETTFVGVNNETTVTREMDSADVLVTIHNAGVNDTAGFNVRMIREFENQIDTVVVRIQGICNDEIVRFRFRVLDLTGLHKFYLEVDPEQVLNKYTIIKDTIDGYVYSPSLLAVEPMPWWNVKYNQPIFRVINPVSNSNKFQYECEIIHLQDSSVITRVDFEDLKSNGLKLYETFIEWSPDILLNVGHSYLFKVRCRNVDTKIIGAWLEVPFYTSSDIDDKVVQIEQGNAVGWNAVKTTNFREVTGNVGKELHLNYQIPFKVTSGVGVGYWDSLFTKYTLEVERTFNIIIQGKTYGDRNDMVGWNIRTLPRNDSIVRTNKWLYTYEHGKPISDGDSDSLIAFLRDSIRENEYVFLAICGNVYGEYIRKYQLDSVINLLKPLGARVADSLNNKRIERSYILIGMKNQALDTVFEAIRPELTRFAGDTVAIIDSVRISPDSGSIETQIFGPAKRWKNFDIVGNLKSTQVKLRVDIYGGSTPFNLRRIILQDSAESIDLSGIDATQFPYIQVRIKVYRTTYKTDPIIKSININLEALSELAVIPSSMTVEPDSVLRSDTTVVKATVQDISLRSPTTTATSQVLYFPIDGSALEVINDKSLLFDSHQTASIVDTMPTIGLATLTSVRYDVNNAKGIRELYYFNNLAMASLKVTDDTVKPTFRLFADNTEVQNGTEVSATPKLVVVMDDNVKLPFTEASLFKTKRYDGKIPDLEASYKFYTTSELSTLPFAKTTSKLAFSFMPTLSFGTHELKVRGADIFGNEQTTSWTFTVANEIKITSGSIAPNPVTSNATFTYIYRGTQQDYPVQVDIFDNLGRVVRSLQKVSRLGTNTIEWDGLDENSISLSQGVYHYRIFVKEFGAESPQNGTFTIVR